MGKLIKDILNDYSKEYLQEIANNSINYYDMSRNLGKTNVTKIFKRELEKCCKNKGINCSHFIGDNYKRCVSCNSIKELSEFYKMSKNKILNTCKDCYKIEQSQKYKQIKENDFNFKKQYKCKKCGEDRYYLLDFHHRNSKEKDFNLSDKTRINLDNFKLELEKCDVLCSNCHREWHFIERHKDRFKPISYDEWISGKEIEEIKHTN